MKPLSEFIKDFNLVLEIQEKNNKYIHTIKFGVNSMVYKLNKRYDFVDLLLEIRDDAIEAYHSPKEWASEFICIPEQLRDLIKYSSLYPGRNPDREFSVFVANAIIEYKELEDKRKKYKDFFGDAYEEFLVCESFED